MSLFTPRKIVAGAMRHCAWISLAVGLMLLGGASRADLNINTLFEPVLATDESILLAAHSSSSSS